MVESRQPNALKQKTAFNLYEPSAPHEGELQPMEAAAHGTASQRGAHSRLGWALSALCNRLNKGTIRRPL